MKKIYISGQITGIKIEWAKQNFHFAAREAGKYHAADSIVNPIYLKPFLGVKCWLCYMITDVYHLRKCTHIAMQKNWIRSKGAVIEYFIAKFILKLEVIWL